VRKHQTFCEYTIIQQRGFNFQLKLLTQQLFWVTVCL